VHAWDLKFAADATRGAELDHAARHGITAHASMQSLCASCDLIISAVTASNTLAVAQEAAQHIRPAPCFWTLTRHPPAPSSSRRAGH
jgi:3-hydroxyisobutyrate dehydrogenase-like beta-hydroxyacid dehydrogenase